MACGLTRLARAWKKPAQDAEWDETKHKRGNGGRFGSGGGKSATAAAAPAKYNAEAVNKSIESSNRHGPKISGKEAKAIHALLKGRH